MVNSDSTPSQASRILSQVRIATIARPAMASALHAEFDHARLTILGAVEQNRTHLEVDVADGRRAQLANSAARVEQQQQQCAIANGIGSGGCGLDEAVRLVLSEWFAVEPRHAKDLQPSQGIERVHVVIAEEMRPDLERLHALLFTDDPTAAACRLRAQPGLPSPHELGSQRVEGELDVVIEQEGQERVLVGMIQPQRLRRAIEAGGPGFGDRRGLRRGPWLRLHPFVIANLASPLEHQVLQRAVAFGLVEAELGEHVLVGGWPWCACCQCGALGTGAAVSHEENGSMPSSFQALRMNASAQIGRRCASSMSHCSMYAETNSMLRYSSSSASNRPRIVALSSWAQDAHVSGLGSSALSGPWCRPQRWHGPKSISAAGLRQTPSQN